MKRLIPLFIIGFLSLNLTGQNEADALRYSQQTPGGTARSVALSGAFGALGGDFSSASVNPAGLGVYRSSELSFTPELYYNFTESRYNTTTAQDWAYNLNFAQFSYVSDFKFKNSDFAGGSFAIGFNRLNNYTSNVLIEGNSMNTSLVDMYIASANNYWQEPGPFEPYELDPFTEKLFFDGYIIDRNDEGEYHLSHNLVVDTITMNVDLYQRNNLIRSGKMNEWTVAAGFNYSHMLYFGASLAMIPVEYRQTSHFREYDRDPDGREFYNFSERLSTDGNGFAAKFGIIVKPIQPLRLGLAFHTPTSFYLSDVYDAQLDSYFQGIVEPIDEEGYVLDQGVYEYTVTTPARTVASLGLILGKFMIFSTDVEYINYAGMRLSKGSDGYDFASENDVIRNIYKQALNVKSGVELRFSNVYLRGGFAYLGSPYQPDELNSDAYRLNYSGGVGFRSKNMFLDFAVSYMTGEEHQVLYDSPYAANVTTAAITSNAVKAMTTLGFRF